MDLYKRYNADEFPKYDNYDAIEVSKVCEIPLDYDGVMGVPITFLGRHIKGYDIIGRLRPYMDGKVKYDRILIRKKNK